MKLVSPKEILLNKNWSHIKGQLSDCIGIGPKYRADIASVLNTRIINYAVAYSQTNSITKDIIERITKLITEPELFANDLKYLMVKGILNGNKAKFSLLMLDQDVVKLTIK